MPRSDDEQMDVDNGDRSPSEHRHKKSKEHKPRKEHKERKHKKEKKSKRKRSRSRSLSGEREETSTSRAPEGNQAAIDSGNVDENFKNSSADDQPNKGRAKSPDLTEGQRVEELSIEETNKLRAKLGLKPLQIGNEPAADGTTKPKREEVHAPPVNFSEVKTTQKLSEKLTVQKEKRLLERKLRKVKGLGAASDEEEGVDAWVQKSRLLEEERKKATERAKILDEYDEEQEAAPSKPRQNYSVRDLSGLKVEHDIEEIQDGREVILTLKDTDVLNDDGDVLVSTALIEQEKNKKNAENRKKKAVYNPYENADDMEQVDEFGVPKILRKYDEEIGGEKKRAFVIDAGAAVPLQRKIQPEAKVGVSIEALITAPPTLASDYINETEMAKFKKPKRMKKVKNEQSGVAGKARSRIIDDDELPLAPTSSSASIPVVEDDYELQLALNQARRARQQELLAASIKQEPRDIIQLLKETQSADVEMASTSTHTPFMDDTSEFCRNIGGNLHSTRSHVKEEPSVLGFQESRDMDVDEEDDEGQPRRGGWSEVQFEAEPANLGSDEDEEEFQMRKKAKKNGSGSSKSGKSQTETEDSVLGIEPSLDRGVAAALKMASIKGLIDNTGDPRHATSNKPTSLPPQNFIVEDKIMDDDKRSRHDRYSGPLVPFKDKAGYKPGFRLEYHDETGRELNQKEAFRQLSHKFHGKGPGKMKTEKRAKKYLEEKLLKEMPSSDTPLHTVQKMKHKQAELQTPFILLSGAQAKTGPTPISKKPLQ